MKVALYQINIVWEEKEENYIRVEEMLKLAGRSRTELFLLPEMSFTGFSMNTDRTKENDDRTVRKMEEYAQKYGMAIGFGWVKDCGEKSENHYTVIDKNGRILSDYTKIHPFTYSGEDRKFKCGNKISIFQLDSLGFSTFICYDLRFPEIFQAASEKADVVIVPANWPRSRREHWKCLLRARAIENQVYIVAVNCVGIINGVNYSGDSCIIDPEGNILQDLTEEEGMLEYDLVGDALKVRRNFPVKKDRRTEFYKTLY